MNELLLIALVMSFSLGILFLLVGQLFGLVAIPNLVEKSSVKYVLLIAAMIIPFVSAVVCLLNYKKTAYASKFILIGLFFTLVTAILYGFMRGWQFNLK